MPVRLCQLFPRAAIQDAVLSDLCRAYSLLFFKFKLMQLRDNKLDPAKL